MDDSLVLLNELSLGFSAGRRLMRLPDIQLLLNNHSVYVIFYPSSSNLATWILFG